MTAKKTDDMTDRGSYNIEHRFYDGPWQVYFAAAAGPYFIGSYDSEEEATEAIAERIEAARECARQEEARHLREAEERVEAARQQIPAAYRGTKIEDCPAARDFVATFKDRPLSGEPLVFGDASIENVKVACCILPALARQGYTTLYVSISDALNARMSDLTAPDFLLIHWQGRVESNIAAAVVQILQARGESKATMIIVEKASREEVQTLLQAERAERIAAEAKAKERAESDAAVAAFMQGPPPPTRYR